MRFVSLLIVATALSGATITFQYSGAVNGLTIGESIDSGATFTDYQSGLLPVTVTSTSGFAGPVPVNFSTFCIEPLQGISAGTYTYTIDPLQDAPNSPGPMGTVKADLLRELFGRYYSSFQQPITAQLAAALQIAIWEIVQESSGPFSVSTGAIRYQSAANPDVIIQANALLASLDGTGPLLSNLYSIRGVSNQDLAFHAEVSVPEPATLVSTALGLLLAVQAARPRVRRFRKT